MFDLRFRGFVNGVWGPRFLLFCEVIPILEQEGFSPSTPSGLIVVQNSGNITKSIIHLRNVG